MYRWTIILVVGMILLLSFTSVVAATPSDTDGDGISDQHETKLGWNPNDADMDNDGLTDGKEMDVGTNPKAKDTDSDGVTDKVEIKQKTDPMNFESNPPETKSENTGGMINEITEQTKEGVSHFPVWGWGIVSLLAGVLIVNRFKN